MPTNNATRFVNSHFKDQNAYAQWSEDGYTKLRAYLGKIRVGVSDVYDTPFAKGESTHHMMRAWIKTLVSIRDTWPSLWKFEMDLAAKVGPMSVELPLSDRIPDIAHYYEDILLSSKPVDQSAMKAVIQELSSVSGLRVRAQDRTVDKMKKSSNSGAPFFTKRREVIRETVPCSSVGFGGRHPDVYSSMPYRDQQVSAVVGWRGQEGGPSKSDVKQRVIWMFPFSVNVNELQVYQPLIEACQKRNLIPAWVSMESVDKEITRLFDTKGSDDLVVATDFSRFDQHFNKHLQDCAETILRSLLTKSNHSSDWLKNIFPIKYLIPLAWDTHTDEFMGEKEFIVSYFEGYHGMASGSGGTNADETLAHRALQYEAAILHGSRLNPHSQCLGDDGILSYPGITVNDVIDAYQSHGQECNKDKQYASTQDCVYLRRWHHLNYREAGVCVGVYSTCRALGRMRYLEKFMDPSVWSTEMVNLRYLSILENVKYHPLKEQFVDFCIKRDKFRLGIDIPGFFDNIVDITEEAIDQMPDFLGYTKTLQGFEPKGILDWWIVNYLKSYR